MGFDYYNDNLISERLKTRKLVKDDIPFWEVFFEDQESTKFLPFLDMSSNLEKSQHMILMQLKRYDDNRFGLHAIFNHETNDFIGLCGLLTQSIEDNTEIEVGYHILKKFQNLGYATEAAKLFIDYAFQHNICSTIVSIINVENVKSQRVAEKNGLCLERQLTMYDNEDVFIYRLKK